MTKYQFNWVAGAKALLFAISAWALLTLVFWPYFYVAVASALTSLVCFVLYGIDKARARTSIQGCKGKLNDSGNHVSRISEASLHFWGLLGGTPGAFVAQQFFRHKTQKLKFRIVFYLTVLLQIMCIILFKLGWFTRLAEQISVTY